MLLDVAEWLVADSCAPDALVERLASSFEPALGYGHGTGLALRAFREGRPWGSCPFLCWPEGSKGNGSTARVAPVALRFYGSPNLLRQYAAMSSWVTHAHRDAIAAATLHAEALALLLAADVDAFDARRFVDDLGISAPDDVAWISRTLEQLRVAAPSPTPLPGSSMALAEVSLPIALAAMVSATNSFESAILGAAAVGGDVDTNCAITGALAGALSGATGIPQLWIRNLRAGGAPVDALVAAADRLYEMHGG